MTRPDTDTAVRMRTAHHRARVLLGVTPERLPVAWGWRGRTLGHAVNNEQQHLWLRLASLPTNARDLFWWDGARAARSLPAALPRPRLHTVADWTDGPWKYRAELYDRAPSATASTIFLASDLDLPASWWDALRQSLEALSRVPTDRDAVRQHRLDRAMPLLLGRPVETHAPTAWTSCHGDLHFANLCAPNLLFLDWEGWGRAPASYDAARLHTAALFAPRTARRIRAELAQYLDSPAGRYAELVVITELLEAASRGTGLELRNALRARAHQLLGRRPTTLLQHGSASRVAARVNRNKAPFAATEA